MARVGLVLPQALAACLAPEEHFEVRRGAAGVPLVAYPVFVLAVLAGVAVVAGVMARCDVVAVLGVVALEVQ